MRWALSFRLLEHVEKGSTTDLVTVDVKAVTTTLQGATFVQSASNCDVNYVRAVCAAAKNHSQCVVCPNFVTSVMQRGRYRRLVGQQPLPALLTMEIAMNSPAGRADEELIPYGPG